jgi:hypothetical protein
MKKYKKSKQKGNGRNFDFCAKQEYKKAFRATDKRLRSAHR